MAPSSPPPQRSLPQPVEKSKRPQRRFAPEPVETSARSGRPTQSQDQSDDQASIPRRRILPQPLESSARSSKAEKKPNGKASPPDPDVISPMSPRRNLPRPIESSTSSSKSRRFAPQLVETTSRQRKRGDTLPTVLDIDKTEHCADDPINLPRHLRIARPGVTPVPPVNSPVVSNDQVPQLHESRFSHANLSKRASLNDPDRRHSFRKPGLPSIPSQTEEGEESSDSSCPSLSTTPSAESDEAELIKNKRIKDGTQSGYILSLAAQAAEKQLREQAMAAYPNERVYEPVNHFAIDQEDLSDKEGEVVGLLSRSATYPAPGVNDGSVSRSRRESHAGWDATELKKHRLNLERQQKEHKKRDTAEGIDRKQSVKEPKKENHHHHHHHNQEHGHHHHHHHHKREPSHPKNQADGNNMIGGHQKDDQMKPMQKAASPPMAGQNLRFPQCKSPRNTRLDVSQYPGAPSHLGHPHSRQHSGLWTPPGSTSRQNSKSGLWMGVCALSAQKPHGPAMFQTGLLTPAVEREDFFVPTSGTQPSSPQQLPPSPPTSIGSNNNTKSPPLNRLSSLERTIDAEFHDGFVTQVYNYLSLGYPALARKYDTELSKITRIPLENLRQDDQRVNAKGYIGAPEGTGCDLRGVQEGRCARWTALRLYVREWARQQPKMGGREGGANEEWGARARKGSWAI
ncbi:MAG: hypothetical protein L6R41_005837 [Letrouitia leprolyta]|nr:MAG: hypothetical protein L6R41_005837 [Letrouitia leprolyta]